MEQNQESQPLGTGLPASENMDSTGTNNMPNAPKLSYPTNTGSDTSTAANVPLMGPIPKPIAVNLRRLPEQKQTVCPISTKKSGLVNQVSGTIPAPPKMPILSNGVKFIIIIASLLVYTLASSFCTIYSGEVGLIKRAGKVQEKHLNSGVHLIIPFVDSVIKIDVRMKSISYASVAFSSDLQRINTEATLQYSISPVLMPAGYKAIGDREKIETNVISQAISQSLKSVTTQYSAAELVTKRNIVKQGIADSIDTFISKSLQEKDLEGLIISNNLALTDFRFSQEFNDAIESKVSAEQEALRAENEKEKVVTQAEAKKRQAELAADAAAYEKETLAAAEAEQIKLLASAQAEKIKEIADANAEAIAKEGSALWGHEDLIRLKLVGRWNGILPKFTGQGGIPLLDMKGMMVDSEEDKKRRDSRSLLVGAGAIPNNFD